MTIPAEPSFQPHRLVRIPDVGRLVAEERRRRKIPQQVFAAKLGVSRKTLSDLERGMAENISLNTAMKALAQAGFVLQALRRRPPTLHEVMARRAEYHTRVEELLRTMQQNESKP